MKHFFIIIFAVLLASCAKPGDISVQQATDAARKQDFSRAESLYLKALEEESNFSDEFIFSMLANLELSRGDYEKAAQWLEKSLANRGDYRLFVTLAAVYSSLGDIQKAEKNLQNAISIDAEKAEALASLGAIRLGQKKYDEAASLLEKAAKASPSSWISAPIMQISKKRASLYRSVPTL